MRIKPESGLAAWSRRLTALVVLVFALAVPAQPLAQEGGCLGQIPTIIGTDGPDDLVGTPHNDVIDGGSGDDVILGGDGNDIICGGDGRDILRGEADDDTLSGGAGRDELDGGTDIDTATYEDRTTRLSLSLNGLADDGEDQEGDFITPSIEAVVGGANDDFIAGGKADETLVGGPGDDVVFGNEGDDVIEGGDGNDTLDGGDGLDTIDGGAGNDTLRGGVALFDDTLDGGAGNDTLDGGPGRDVLTGGGGADRLYGGPDPDVLEARDDTADSVIDCGAPGFVAPVVDVADVDLADRRPAGCETINRWASKEVATVLIAHGIDIPVSLSTLRARRGGRVSVRLTCPKRVVGHCVGRLTLRTPDPLRRVGSRRYRIGAGHTRTVRVTLSRRGRRLLHRRGALKLRATAVARGAYGPKTAIQTLRIRAR